MTAKPQQTMSYIVHWDQQSKAQIAGLPQGSTADDVVPNGCAVMGTGYASRAEAQRATKKYEGQHRARWTR